MNVKKSLKFLIYDFKLCDFILKNFSFSFSLASHIRCSSRCGENARWFHFIRNYVSIRRRSIAVTRKKIHSFLVVIFFIPAFLLQCCQFFFLNFSLKTCTNFCVGDDEFRVHKMRHADDYDDDEITPDNLRLHTSRSC